MLAAVKARRSAPPPLRGADGLDAGCAHERPGSCLTRTHSRRPEARRRGAGAGAQAQRWLLLKRPEKLTGEQRGRLAELVRRNLRTVRAYLLKEDFQSLWGYVSPYWAGQFLDRWCTRTMRSRLDPMKEVARMVALAPRPDSELVPSPGAVLQWRCRRLQRKGQSDHQTGVWVPHLRGTGSRFVSRTWRPARTKTHPQILLTRPNTLLHSGLPKPTG